MKILERYRGVIIVAALLLVFLVIVFLQINTGSEKKEEHRKLSLIVYGDDSERWESVRQGAELICGENSADLRVLTMSSDNDHEEQEQIIKREIDDGADALVIAACDSANIRDFTEGLRTRIPIVFIESLAENDGGLTVITPDDYKMGYEMGEAIIEGERQIATIAIISDNTKRDSVSLREQGLRDAIEGKFVKVINWTKDESRHNLSTRTFIQRAIVSEATDVIVTFDNTTTDALIDALTNLNKQSKVYSISTSEKAVYSLNKGMIKSLEYTDEFSMGYLAALYALDHSKAKDYSDKEIDFKIVRKEDMYDEDNQELLFPSVN